MRKLGVAWKDHGANAEQSGPKIGKNYSRNRR